MRPAKKLLLVSITALVSLALLEGASRALEAGGAWLSRRSGPAENRFISAKDSARVFERATVDGRDLYVRTHQHWILGHQSFQAVKSKETFRVFCIGSSASMGWPHPPQYAYPGLLAEKLRRLYPGKRIEVLNVGGNTYASYRSKIVFDEVIGYEPDLVIVYMGNNEFLEDFVYNPETAVRLQTTLREPWSHFALVCIFHRFLTAEPPRPVIDVKDYGWRDLFSNRLSLAFGLAAKRRRDPQQFRIVREHYRYNVEQMAEESRRYADAYFYLGRALEREERLPEAKAAYWDALNHDAYPFRCPFNADLSEIAERRRLALVDTIAALEHAAVHGILGFDLLVDYVHPTVAGNEIIAQEVLVAMQRAGLLPASPAVPLAQVRLAIPPNVEDDLTPLRSLYGQFFVMRQYTKLSEIAGRLRVAMDRELSGDEPRIRRTRRELLDRLDAVEKVLGPYQQLLLAEKRGNLDEVFTHDEAERIFADYVALVRAFEAAKLSEEYFASFVPRWPSSDRALGAESGLSATPPAPPGS